MDYVIFDLEWNQCPYGKGKENPKLPFEIIEIGAVKMDGERNVVGTFHRIVKPVVYQHLHHPDARGRRTDRRGSAERNPICAGRAGIFCILRRCVHVRHLGTGRPDGAPAEHEIL